MIVTIQGTEQDNAVKTACVLAEFTALTKKSKTLVLQFMDNAKNSTENLLIGKSLRLSSFDDEIADAGIGMDALLRKVKDTKLTKENFLALCTPMCNTDNLFDVANISNKLENAEEYEIFYDEGHFENLLSNAKDVYDFIFLIVDTESRSLAKKINEHADKSVFVVPQGEKRKLETCGKDVLYVVTDYEDVSKYSLKVMKKEYSAKQMYPLLYNVYFNDAVEEGTLYRFIAKNKENGKEDENYAWYVSAKSLVEKVTEIIGEEEEVPCYLYELPANVTALGVKDTEVPLIQTANNDTEILVKKKRLFHKRENIRKNLGDVLIEQTESELNNNDTDLPENAFVDEVDSIVSDVIQELEQDSEGWEEVPPAPRSRSKVAEKKATAKKTSETKTSTKKTTTKKTKAEAKTEEDKPKDAVKKTTKSKTATAKTVSKKADTEDATKKTVAKKTASKASSTTKKAATKTSDETTKTAKAVVENTTAKKTTTAKSTTTKATVKATSTTKKTAAKAVAK